MIVETDHQGLNSYILIMQPQQVSYSWNIALIYPVHWCYGFVFFLILCLWLVAFKSSNGEIEIA